MSFLTIFSLLLPVTGYAIYNFLIAPYGLDLGLVWFLTSLVCFNSYLGLSYFLQKRWFNYFLAGALVSVSLSVIYLTGIPQDFLILTGLVTANAMLIISRLLPKNGDYLKALSYDLLLSSAATLLASIVIGEVWVLGNKLSFFETKPIIAVLLVSVYLWQYYLHKPIVDNLLACLAFSSWTLYSIFIWFGLSDGLII